MSAPISKDTVKRAGQIQKLAARKCGVSRAEAKVRLGITNSQWQTAIARLKLTAEGVTKATRYYA